MTKTYFSRRTFLALGGASLAAISLAPIGTQAANGRPVPLFDIPLTRTKESNMPILIAYATRSGSTREIAQRMGEMLTEQGIENDVLDVKKVRSVNGYSGVVLGSAIRMAKPMGEATRFVKGNQETLAKLPVAFFSVSLAAREGEGKEAKAKVPTYLASLKEIVTPVATADFAGMLDLSTMGPILRFFFAKAGDDMPQGDFRDWDAIKAWTTELADKLS